MPVNKLRGRVHQITNRILRLVREYPEVVTSYEILIFRYWAEYEGELLKQDHLSRIYFVDESQLSSLTSSLSIGRAFRALVEAGKIVVPDRIQDERDKLEGEYVQVFGGGLVGE